VAQLWVEVHLSSNDYCATSVTIMRLIVQIMDHLSGLVRDYIPPQLTKKNAFKYEVIYLSILMILEVQIISVFVSFWFLLIFT